MEDEKILELFFARSSVTSPLSGIKQILPQNGIAHMMLP